MGLSNALLPRFEGFLVLSLGLGLFRLLSDLYRENYKHRRSKWECLVGSIVKLRCQSQTSLITGEQDALQEPQSRHVF